jgi:hypothetical protein
MDEDYVEELTYLPTEPEMGTLRRAYDGDVLDAATRLDQIADARDQRNCYWANKSRTQRKDYKGAKPWIGASDQEVPMIEYAIDTANALNMNAFDNGNFNAIPVGSDDIERGAVTSQFIRWQMSTQIPNARTEIELASNYLLEKADVATWVGHEKQPRRHEEEFTIEDIAKVSMELAEMMMDEETPVEEIIEQLEAVPNIESIPPKKAKRAIKEMQKTGVAKIPVLKGDINRPVISTKEMHSDVIVPYYTTDPQRADRIHVRFFMSPQALLEKVWSEDWDKDFVEDVIENHMGITSVDFDGAYSRRRQNQPNNSASVWGRGGDTAEDMAVIVRTYQRFVDPEDGATAIYETVWCPKMGTENRNGGNAYAKFGILNGWGEYPIAFTRWKDANKRWGDVRGVVDSLRGTQRQGKVTRDGTVDQTSLNSSPPRTHRAGAPVQRWGADADIPIRRGDEGLYKYLDVPDSRRDNTDLERFLNEEIDRSMGFTPNDPIAVQKQQHNTNRFLSHVSKVARLIYKSHQKYGEDELHFRITGQPDPIVFNKSAVEEELDVSIVFDSRMTQPDFVKDIVDGLDSLMASDRTGRIDPDAFIDIRTSLILPQYVGRLLRPTQEAQEDITKRILDDLNNINMGAQVNANTQGADVAMQFLAQWEQTPRAQQWLSDPVFAQMYVEYKGQYEMELVQRQNAQIGANINPNAVVQAGQ